ncbi:membrane protein [Thermostichus sp. MS-CIW-21]|jgi:membrane protein
MKLGKRLGTLPSFRQLQGIRWAWGEWSRQGELAWRTLRLAWENAMRYRLFGLASEMAYSSMLALFPFILTLLTGIGLFVGSSEQAFQRLMEQLGQIAPQEALVLLERYAREIRFGENRGLLSLSFLGTLWAASGALGAVMTALDLSHEIPQEMRRPFWRRKLISMVWMLATLGLTGLASLIFLFSASFFRFLSAQAKSLAEGVAGPDQLDPWRELALKLWEALTWPISLGMIVVSCWVLYRFGPSLRRPQMPIWPGAIVASLLWVGVSWGLRVYVEHFGQLNQVYGAVGAVIVLLLWVWLTSLALLFGDQINIALYQARQWIRDCSPTPHANADPPPHP